LAVLIEVGQIHGDAGVEDRVQLVAIRSTEIKLLLSILEIPSVRRQAKPIDLRIYHWMGENGFADEKTELLRGVIVEKISKSPLHEYIIGQLLGVAQNAVKSDHLVRKEGPLTLVDSEPEPDIAIVCGSLADFRLAHPGTARLVIEVAISSVDVDREKAAIYAEADIPEYWLVIPEKNTMEIHSSPKNGIFTQRRVLGVGEIAIAAEFPELTVNLQTLFQGK